jgi:sialic acid synthase SpsE
MDLFQLREQFSRDGILMCFNGPFSHSIIEEIGIAIRNHLAAENIARMAVQDVFAIYIEMTQNARNYLTRKNISPADAGSATIVIARRGESYAVTSGNVVLKEDIEQLRSRIDHINALEPDELKKLIRQQLRAEVPAGATGAGIGLMEMAKRASNRLEYSVRDIDGGHSFFTLTAQI